MIFGGRLTVCRSRFCNNPGTHCFNGPNRFVPLFFLLILTTLAWPAWAEKVVRLAAYEQSPYIGQELPGQGYVAELVQAALQPAGYKVDIRFYPAARARSLAAGGQVDGFLPAAGDAALAAEFQLSSAFPGGSVGLLKKRSLTLDYPADAPRRSMETLRALKQYRFGAVRGAGLAPEFDAADFLRREYVASDLQNLDKLALGRIDLMLVDKYGASDLMTLQRPHLIGGFEFLNPPLFRRDFHVAFSRKLPGYEKLVADFNRGLFLLKRSGRLEELQRKHGFQGASEAKAGRKVLTIGTVNNPDMLLMKSMAGEFERENPGLALEWRILDENSLRTRLMTDLAIADGQFDVMTIGAYEAPLWASRGWILPLDDLPAAYDVGDLLPTVRGSLSYRGQLFALPFYAESSMTYYRTDLFRMAGVSMPERPTWEDIGQLAAATHNPQKGVYGLCLRGKPGWGDNMALLGAMVNAYGGRWFNDRWQPEIDSEPWQRAIGTYVDLLRRFGPPNSVDNSFNENLALFADGRCAIWVDATVAAGLLFNPKNSSVAGHLGFAASPGEPGKTGTNWLWTWALAIPQTSERKAAARRFVEWATSKAYIRAVARREGWVAVPPGTRQSTYAIPEYQAAAPFSLLVRDALLAATVPAQPPRPYSGIQFVGIPEFPAIGHQVGTEISRAVAGKITAEQALSNAQALVLRQMEASGYLRNGRR